MRLIISEEDKQCRAWINNSRGSIWAATGSSLGWVRDAGLLLRAETAHGILDRGANIIQGFG